MGVLMGKLYLLIVFLLVIEVGSILIHRPDIGSFFMPLLAFLVGYWASTSIKKARKVKKSE